MHSDISNFIHDDSKNIIFDYLKPFPCLELIQRFGKLSSSRFLQISRNDQSGQGHLLDLDLQYYSWRLINAKLAVYAEKKLYVREFKCKI